MLYSLASKPISRLLLSQWRLHGGGGTVTVGPPVENLTPVPWR